MAQQIESVFQRYEVKYLLNQQQFETLRARLKGYMAMDSYGRHTICNLYFDTDQYTLIRNSIEKPIYKEKLRLRSYGIPQKGDPVFLEIKKKYDGIVYKRRVKMSLEEARNYFRAGLHPAEKGQIMREIDWFIQFYQPKAKAFIAYDRIAFFGQEDSELRLTFDQNIRARSTQLELSQGDWGSPLLQTGQILMEIKIPAGAPLWLSRLLSELNLFPTSFSKYGICYQKLLFQEFSQKEVKVNVG